MPLSAGDKLGPYEILAPIGAGGMGQVYRARDPRLGRDVAIKVSAERFTERFEREARAIAALNHPNICTLYDIGPNYLVMEFIDGSPLRGPLRVEEAVRRGIQITAALEEAHAKHILHRDLKPGNILVTAKGALKLLDFGIAKLEADSDATQTMTVMGTPLYMSPEQAEGKPLDRRSDVFSFGAVLYEMLTGVRAFDSLSAVLGAEPKAFDAPPELRQIATKCLRKSPADRFQSITEVRAALESFAAKPLDEPPSIAILPFANMSANKENEYFSDGLAEEILNALAKTPGLKVIARTSSFAFRGKEQDITKIAETLRVKAILEGSVRTSGNRLRVTAQLVSAADGSHLWSERYDRELADVFEIQDDISQKIANALRVKLLAPRRPTQNVEAYQNYLKGIFFFERAFTPQNVEKARVCFEQALDRSELRSSARWIG